MSTNERVMRGVVRAESIRRMVFGYQMFWGAGDGTVWFITKDQRETHGREKKKSNGLDTLFCDPVRAVQVVACALMSVQRNTLEGDQN
jgi:hypothetical protein